MYKDTIVEVLTTKIVFKNNNNMTDRHQWGNFSTSQMFFVVKHMEVQRSQNYAIKKEVVGMLTCNKSYAHLSTLPKGLKPPITQPRDEQIHQTRERQSQAPAQSPLQNPIPVALFRANTNPAAPAFLQLCAPKWGTRTSQTGQVDPSSAIITTYFPLFQKEK